MIIHVRTDMVVCYVIRPTVDGSDFEFLQLRRSIDDYMGGTWQTVFGTSKGLESAVETAIRELQEETALAPRELYRVDCVQTFHTAMNDTLWHAVPFAAVIDRSDEIKLNDEHDSARWLSRHTVREAFIWSTDRTCVDLICRDIIAGSEAKSRLKIELKVK